MELGDQGGYMADPQASFLWTACLHAITLHLLCGRMLRDFLNPLVIYLDLTHNDKPSLIIKWLPVGREIML